MGREVFEKTCGDILRTLRASEKAAGHDRIYTAGEKEWDMKEFRKDKGVPMGEAVQKEFMEVRDELGIDMVFPFE
jgi:LDH2 family malate/lactate/ureidoglycolate dehydrogenase